MSITKTTPRNIFARLFTDSSLTKKASLNALASLLDYGGRLVIGFVLQPIKVALLGDYFFGAWQILNGLVMYISPSSGGPFQALRWTLAHEQTSTDFHMKRQIVASSVVVWAILLPFLVIAGTIMTWFVPFWIQAPPEYFLRIRVTIIILMADLIMSCLGSVPFSVLQGENMAYRRIGLSVALIAISGGLTWFVLVRGWGIIGLAGVTLAMTLLSAVLYINVTRTYAPWFGLAKPSREMVRKFLDLSWWFLVWNLVMNFMLASDVIVLGMLNKVEAVTSYALTKYAPDTLIQVIAIVTFGVVPGLGGIIGSGDLKKAARLRGELMTFTWLVITILGTSVLLWNRTFISLWAGEKYYTGPLSALLIVIVVAQFVLFRNDSNIIDLTLNIRQKVLIGSISAAISIGIASLLVSVFQMGVIGVSVGLLLGRMILTLGYPLIIGRFLGVTLSSQMKNSLKPTLITAILFSIALLVDYFVIPGTWQGISGWAKFLVFASLSALIVLVVAFYTGLTSDQRKVIVLRVRSVVSLGPG